MAVLALLCSLLLLGLFFVGSFLLLKRWPEKKTAAASAVSRLPLPPGSMGWPYVGETFQLYSAKNPNAFLAAKQRRHGPVFKTHILGCPCVMVSTPAAARFVLVTQAHLFKPTYPASKERMIGPRAVFFQQGDYHARLRRLILRAFSPDSIRLALPNIEAVAAAAVRSWDGRPVNTFNEMKTYAFNVALLSIFGKTETAFIEELKTSYLTLEKGYNSMPVNLPGTLFHKAMAARRRLAGMVGSVISVRRRASPAAAEHGDLLASFMEGKESLTDEQIADNIIGVIFAARDTTASVLTWVVKFLGDHPAVLRAVVEEQEEVKAKNAAAGAGLTWADTKQMRVTARVIQETMRVASVLSFTFREAVEDVELQGYRIPKGWKVMPLFRNIHHDAEHFPSPETFDPARFEAAPKPNTFMPFGNGIHSCPGNELAKLEMLVLLHHLTTNYWWSTKACEAGVQFGPFALPINGLPMTFTRKAA